MIELASYRAEHHSRFVELNRAWLLEHGLLEHADQEQLDDPIAHFIAPGGAIFVALHGDQVVGTAAVVPHGPGEWEVAKLAVDPAYRGHGIGTRLVERCIAAARAGGARWLTLVSSHKLGAAVALYRRLGFVDRPRPANTYATADVYMQLALHP